MATYSKPRAQLKIYFHPTVRALHTVTMCHWCTKFEALQCIDSKLAKPVLALLAKFHKTAEPYYGDVWLVRLKLTSEIHEFLVKAYEKRQSAVLERMIAEIEDGVNYIKMHMRSHPPNHLEMGRLKRLKEEIYPHESASNEVSKGSLNSNDSIRSTKGDDKELSKNSLVDNTALGKERDRGVRKSRKERLVHQAHEKQVLSTPKPVHPLRENPPSLPEIQGSDLDPSPQIQAQSIRAVQTWLNGCNEAMSDDIDRYSNSDAESLISLMGGGVLERPDMDVKLWSRRKSLKSKGRGTGTGNIKVRFAEENDSRWNLQGLTDHRRSPSCSSHGYPPRTLSSQPSLQSQPSQSKSSPRRKSQTRSSHTHVTNNNTRDSVFDRPYLTVDLDEAAVMEAGNAPEEARGKFSTARFLKNMSKMLNSKPGVPFSDEMKIIKTRESCEDLRYMMSGGRSLGGGSSIFNFSVETPVYADKARTESTGWHLYNASMEALVHQYTDDDASAYDSSVGEKPSLGRTFGNSVLLTAKETRNYTDRRDNLHNGFTHSSSSLLVSKGSAIDLDSITEKRRREKSVSDTIECHLAGPRHRQTRHGYMVNSTSSDLDSKESTPRLDSFGDIPPQSPAPLKQPERALQSKNEPSYTNLRRGARHERTQEPVPAERVYRGASRREERRATAVNEPVHVERAHDGGSRGDDRRSSALIVPATARREVRKDDRQQPQEVPAKGVEEAGSKALRQRRVEKAAKISPTDKFHTEERQKHWHQ